MTTTTESTAEAAAGGGGLAAVSEAFAKLQAGEGSQEGWDAMQRLLVDQLIELESPKVTRSMLGFLNSTRTVRLLVDVVTRRRDGTSVEVVDESKRADLDKGSVMAFKWRRAVNPYPDGESAYLHHSFDAEVTPEEAAARKRSYAVMALLCGLTQRANTSGYAQESFHASQKTVEEPSLEVMQFTRLCSPALVAYLFDAFHPESLASVYHVSKLLDVLMRFHAEVVLSSLLDNRKALKAVLEAVLQYVHYPCVSDLFLILACPVPRNQREADQGWYSPSPSTREQYFRALSSMNILLVVAEHIWAPEAPQAHKAAAADLLQCMVQKYSGLTGCADLLSALVRSPELLQGLIAVSCGEESRLTNDGASDGDRGRAELKTNRGKSGGGGGGGKKKGKGKGKKKGGKKKPAHKRAADKAKQEAASANNEDEDGNDEGEDADENEETTANDGEGGADAPEGQASDAHSLQRDAALDTLRCIIDLSTKKQVQNTEPREYTSFADMQNNVVECQLAPISERLHSLLDASFETLCHAMLDSTGCGGNSSMKDVKHSIYVVKEPFSNYRLELIKLVIVCVSHKPKTLLSKIPESHWQRLVRWFHEYPHCNLYHSEFRELFTVLLRTSGANEGTASESLLYVLDKCGLLAEMLQHFTDDKVRSRESVAGHVLMMFCAMRLQVQAVEPTHPLAVFLAGHAGWQAFQPTLELEAHRLVQPWPASNPAMLTTSPTMVLQDDKKAEVAKLMAPAAATGANGDAAIDLGSELATKLGFAEVAKFDPDAAAAGGARRARARKKH